MDMKICYNNYRNDLYCVECKEKIKIGEKYIIVNDIYMGEKFDKCYHIDHVPIVDEVDEIYIIKDN